MDADAGGDAGNPPSSSLGPFGIPLPPKSTIDEPKSSIPKPKQKPKPKSVIYGSGSGLRPNYEANNNINPLSSYRTPWVPAPGKSTTTNGPTINKKTDFEESNFISSSSSTTSYKGQGVKPVKSKVFRPVTSRTSIFSQTKKSLKKSASKASQKPSKKKSRPGGYTLKSKDSLVDVTAFLQAKREEILKLWQENLKIEDEELLTHFQTANTFALEAAQEVENLRQSIQNLHDKESSLSEGDCDMLDKLRNQVLSKVKAFEEVNAQVHTLISEKNVESSVTDDASSIAENKGDNMSFPIQTPYYGPFTVPASRSTSGTTRSIGVGGSVSTPEVVFIKPKSPYFDTVDESDEEHPEGIAEIRIPPPPVANRGGSNTTAKTASTVPSTTADLSRLGRLYAENYDLPRVYPGQNALENIKFHAQGSQKYNSKGRSVRFENVEDSQREQDKGLAEQAKFYQDRLIQLQRQLLETEAEMDELKENLQRVESDSNFQVRMLKSSVDHRLETLESFPEYLQITEKRLMDTMQVKVQLERVLDGKEKEICHLKEVGDKQRKELEEMKDKLRSFQNTKDFMEMKVSELERFNQNLRKDLDDKNKEIDKLTQRLDSVSIENRSYQNHHQHQQKSKSQAHSCDLDEASKATRLALENQRLELKCIDLKDRLAKARKDIQSLQTSKNKLSSRSHRHQEEILRELEQTRAKCRTLQSQIHYIRTTYTELFPTELFNTSPIKQSHKTTQRSKIISNLLQAMDEPHVTKTTTWETTNKGSRVSETNESNEDEGTYNVEN